MKKYTVLRIGLLAIIFGVLIWGMCLPEDVTIYNQEAFYTLDSGWEQMEQKDTIVLNRIITDDMSGKSLVFYAEHQEVFVTIGDRVVYEFVCPEYLECFGSPGRTWVNVPIAKDVVGEPLNVILHSEFRLFQGFPDTLYCIDDSEMHEVQMDFLWLRNTVALLVLALACVSYINAMLWEQKKMRHYLFTMADLYLFVALWLCSEVNILAIWFGRSFLSSVFSVIFMRIIPIAFYHFFLSVLPYTSWRTRVMGGIAWGNLIVAVVMQLLGVSLIHTLWLNLLVFIVMSTLSLVEMVYYFRSRKQIRGNDYAVYLLVLLLVAFLIECYTYVNYLDKRQWLGIPLTMACIVYAVVSHVLLVRVESDNDMKKRKLEEDYNNLHKKPLYQQINAHFLYNSLNTISAYCKEDPELADKTVLLMAQYMRGYTNLIGESEYVTLAEELELIQDYMDIQNMRFENSIDFRIENSCDDIMLPPLSLQPLVENAVNHGLRNRRYQGEIVIEAHRKCDRAEIVVKDNGTGFDIGSLKSVQGVGLRNLEKRIVAMGGCMIVHSRIDKGTEVILSVPIDDNGEDLQL